MTETRDSRFFVSLLKTNLGMFLFSFSDFSYFSVHSNYSAWIFVGIVASHHQVHNELIALLILFIYLSVIDNRRSSPHETNCSAHAQLLSPRYYDLLLPCPSKRLSSSFKSFRRRMAAGISRARMNQKSDRVMFRKMLTYLKTHLEQHLSLFWKYFLTSL
jgi:hypothetical protein